MGACGFEEYHNDCGGLQKTYVEACNAAEYEYGRDSYNGTISTTNGARQVVSHVLTNAAARFYADVHSEDGEKWGPCCAIPVASDENFKFQRGQFTVVMSPERDVVDWDGKPTGEKKPTTLFELQEECRRQAAVRFGDNVHSIEIKPYFKTKLVVSHTEGKPTTVYLCNNREYATKAAAISAAKQLLSEADHFQRVTVKAMKRWPTTADALVVNKVTTAAEATVVVTTAHPRGVVTLDGWLFFGWAAC